MRIFFFIYLVLIISGCTTVEVTKEIIKAGNSVKKSVKEIVPKTETENKTEKKDNEIIQIEKEIISQKQKEEKGISTKQQELTEVNFIGKSLKNIKKQLGEPDLSRTDGITNYLRYDSNSCRLFLFLNIEINQKIIEYFEIRNLNGELLKSKQSIENCYKEFDLIK